MLVSALRVAGAWMKMCTCVLSVFGGRIRTPRRILTPNHASNTYRQATFSKVGPFREGSFREGQFREGPVVGTRS